MTRGRNSRAQNRGRKLRMSAASQALLHEEMDSLAAELGVPTMAEDMPAPQVKGNSPFGLPEVLAVMGVFATAGLLNMAF